MLGTTGGDTSMDWVQHVIWWHIYPLGFLGADVTGADRRSRRTLADIEPWLDDVIDLGLNGILLAPIFESETHGYDTVDYYRIDSRLGSDDDFTHLLDAAHRRGIRVLLDGVFNHVGRSFRPPAAIPTTSEGDLLRRTATGDVAVFEGHGQLVELNHADDRVADLVVSVMIHWLDLGIDGWRLDAAYAVPSEFWASVIPRVRAAHPDAYFVGEYIHGDYSAAVRDGQLDSVTQYELWQGIWHALDEQNFFELDWALTRHNQLLESFVPFTFVGNHDVTRIASLIQDSRHLPHAIVLLMTLGGTPAIYYGDERGERGVKEARFGGDDAVRPTYPTSPADSDESHNETYLLHRELIGLRRRNPWLAHATSQAITLTNTQYVYEVRANAHRLIVALNLSDRDCPVDTPATTVVAGHATGSTGTWKLAPHGWAVFDD